MPDLHYVDPRLAALYDIECGWSPDRDFYLGLAGRPPQRILDLGCGTGLICDAYATLGHAVTGVDPAPAMLDIARHKPNGGRIEWVNAHAEAYRGQNPFDLIIMTGHAFQVLLDDADILATFSAVRANLKPGGSFVFESRNPAIDWATKWNYDSQIETADGTVHKTTRVLEAKGDRLTFEQSYRFAGETLSSTSTLRFLSRDGIEARLEAAGLRAGSVSGDWASSPFDPQHSEEAIFIASHRS